jgi:hypothetical protein
MTDRKIFGLIVRVFGLWWALWSLEWLFSPVIVALKPQEPQEVFPPINGIQPPPLPPPASHAAAQLASGGWRLLVGLLLFFLANQIVRLAYRKSPDNSD